jgi:ABC-type multidrug transport system ATPase subunit
VLDEPTNHLDIHYQLDLLELVRSLATTTLFTLHDLNLTAAYRDRLYLLAARQIVASGTPEPFLAPAVSPIRVNADHPKRRWRITYPTDDGHAPPSYTKNNKSIRVNQGPVSADTTWIAHSSSICGMCG